MKKLFTLLAALATTASLMAQDVTVDLSPSTLNSTTVDDTGYAVTEFNNGYSITNASKKNPGSGNNANDGNKYLKYSSGVQYTIVIPEGKQITTFTMTGGTRKAGTTTYLKELGGTTYGKTDYVFVDGLDKTAGATATTHTIVLDTPAKGTLTFTPQGTESLFNFILIEESAADDREDAAISWSESEVSVKNTELNPVFPTLTNDKGLGIIYASSNEAVAAIDAEGNITVNGIGTTTITATAPDTYKNNKVSYTLSVVRGDVVFAWNAEGMTLGTLELFGSTTYEGNTAFNFANGWKPEATDGKDGHAEITVEGGFKAGDVIAITGWINGGAGKSGAVNVHTSYENILWTSPTFYNKKGDPAGELADGEAATYTLCLKENVNTLYLSRTGNTNTKITSILVTRDPNAQNELKNIYLAGNINGWNTENIDYKFATADYKTYTLNLPKGLKGEFKLVVDGEWYGSSNAKVGEVFNMHSPDNNAIAPTLGKTTFTLNVDDFTALVEGEEYTPVYFIGESTADESGAWLANKIELNTNDGVNYSHNFAQGFAGAWRLYVSESVSFGKNNEQNFEYANGKFTLPAVGVENFDINFNEGVTLNVALADRASVKDAPVASEISLVEDAAPVKIYFANTLGWETVKAHFFHDSWGTAWPGNKMNLEGNSQPAEAVAYSLAPLADEVAAKTTYHSIEIPASATGVVINNDGAAQTEDIMPEHMMLYTPSGETNSEGKYVVNKETTTGVEDVEVENAAAEAVYYNLQGVRVDNPAAGNVYIRRQGAKTEKIRF